MDQQNNDENDRLILNNEQPPSDYATWRPLPNSHQALVVIKSNKLNLTWIINNPPLLFFAVMALLFGMTAAEILKFLMR